jgi:hypothetical protein
VLVLQYLVGRGYPTCGAATERKIEKLAPEPGPLRARSCIVDGEAVACDGKGLAVFDLIREHRGHAAAELCAFDLPELDGQDHRRARIEERKRASAGILDTQSDHGGGRLCHRHVGRSWNHVRRPGKFPQRNVPPEFAL